MADLSPEIADSGADNYLAGRAMAQRAVGDREWQALISGTPKAPATSSAAPAAGSDPDAGTLPVMPDYWDQLSPGGRLVASPSMVGSGISAIGNAVGATVADVGRGVIDAPRQIIGGALDAFNNMSNLISGLDKKAAKAGLTHYYLSLHDENGNFSPSLHDTAEGLKEPLHVPTTGQPDTVTGQVIRQATPYMIGRAAAPVPGSGVATEAAKDFFSGFVSQDPAQPRLSNIIDQVAPNAVTDFLKAKPGDEDSILGRVKSGLEFSGLGLLFEGAKRALKGVKGAVPPSELEQAIAEPGTAETAGAAGSKLDRIDALTADRLAAERGDMAAGSPSRSFQSIAAGEADTSRDFLRLGDPLAPAVEIKPTARDAAMAEVTASRMQSVEGVSPGLASGTGDVVPNVMSDETIHAYLSGARLDNPVKVNLERIGSNEDIADALAQVSKTIPKQAVQSNEATIAAADALGLQPAEFLNGYKGQNLNASETTAMRFMLDSSADQLVEFAKAARDPLADAQTKAQFLKAFTVHRSLQSYFENARAEAGRTLQAWSIMSQQRSDFSKTIGDMVRNAEGADGDLGDIAEKIATLNPLQAGRFVAGSMQGSGKDMLLKVWYNSLLSSPTTVVKKLISDVGMATWNVATTGLAEKFGSSVPEGETGQLLAGYTGSFKDAVRAGWKALKEGESQFYKDYSTWEGAVPGSPAQAVAKRFNASMAWNGAPEMINPEEPTRGAFEYIRSLMPTSWIAGADDFAKVWNYRAEVRRLAWRSSEGDADTFARLLDQPTPQVNQMAVSAALKNTFQEPLGALGESVRNAVDAVSFQIPHTNFELPLGRMIVPFTKVPFNIAKTAALNSPLALLMREPQAILAGGPSAARDLMLARIGLGSGLSLGLADLALNNYLTGKGPSDASLRAEWIAAGHQPYSLEIPGLSPVRLNQIEPFGMTLGAIADTFNILKFSEDEKDFGTLLPSLALGIGNAMLSKTYFEGIGRFLDAVAHPEKDGNRWAEGIIAGFSPQLASRTARALDEWERAHYGYIDAIEEKLPFLRNNLPPQRTLWGDPVPIREGFFPLISGTPLARVVSPMQMGRPPDSAEPIDKWIWENRSAFPLMQSGDPRGIAKIGRSQIFGNAPDTITAQLNPQAYDRLQALAGNELKDPRTGQGAKDRLNALVQGASPSASEQRTWDSATPEAKAVIVSNTVARYRSAAKQQLLHDDKDLAAQVLDGLKARGAALTGKPPQ